MDNEEKISVSNGNGFWLGDWHVIPMSGLFKKGEHQVHVEPKVMDVLVCLANHSGEVVSRDQLLDEVWGKAIVTDDAITRCISELRSVFGDTDRERNYIKTVPRRGYMLVMPVGQSKPGRHSQERESNTGHRNLLAIAAIFLITIVIIIYSRNEPVQEGAASVVNTSAENTPDKATSNVITSLAVLPFANLSFDSNHEYFSDGLSEDIRNALMVDTDIRIAARTSSSVFKDKAMDVREIAQRLGVDALIEGTVRIIDDRLKITTQLTDGNTGYAIWSAGYERSLDDKIVLQGEIAEQIVRQLAPSLINKADLVLSSTSNVQAHDYYLLGRHHWHQRTAESLRLAQQYFERAIDLDREYALAFSGLADALVFQTIYADVKIEDIQASAKEAIDSALELEPGLSEAHASLGIFLEESGNRNDAVHSYRRAIELKPQNSMAQMWLGTVLMKQRNMKGAHQHYQRALELDPLHPMIQFNYLHSLTRMGRFNDALTDLDNFYQFNPSEDLLKVKMGIYFEIGDYTNVLTMAVGHSFTDEYRPYSSKHVVNTLIELQRYDEARQILEDNSQQFGKWLYDYSRFKLALAERDVEAINLISSQLDKTSIPDMYVDAGCVSQFKIFLTGLAEFIDGEYVNAIGYFDELQSSKVAENCLLSEPEHELMVLLFNAASRFKLNSGDYNNEQQLNLVNARLQEYKSLGWNTPLIVSLEMVFHYLSNNLDNVTGCMAKLESNGWQLLGYMRSNPLFDDLLSSNVFINSSSDYEGDFKETWNQCDVIELTKLGI